VIEIVPYDWRWPARFDEEAARIREAMAGTALRVEHVGSTSVPGLAAKPVIDIQVSVASLDNLEMHAAPLARLGYKHVPFGSIDLDYPFFQKPEAWPTTHHIHVCVLGSEHERRHLAFRDYLRAHPEVAAEYVAVKRRLAAEHGGATPETRELYSLSKSEFVRSVLERIDHVRIAARDAAHYPASSPDARARPLMSEYRTYRNFREFYPFYLSEHANRTSRRLHVMGTTIAAALLIVAVFTQAWWLVGVALVQGYACAWIGHFFFEHNKPATFRYPRLSFIGDWRLWWDTLTGKIPF
jgi:GrpB-like predicted nucleotidyltransferase (UPF0157 family)